MMRYKLILMSCEGQEGPSLPEDILLFMTADSPCTTSFSALSRTMMPGAPETPEESYSTPRAYKPAGITYQTTSSVMQRTSHSGLSHTWAQGSQSHVTRQKRACMKVEMQQID